MARNIDWDSVPDSTLLPDNMYVFEIESITEGASKAGHLMYTGAFRVADGEFTGTPLYDRFAIGTNDDPTADDPQTWVKSIGARRMKRLFKAAMPDLPLAGNIDEMIRVATQQRFVAMVNIEEDDGVKDPKYKGVKRNRIAAMYPATNVVAPVAPVATKAAAPLRTVAPKPAAPKAAAQVSAPKVPTVKCGYCQAMIPRDDYVNHIDQQHPDAE